MNVILVMVQTLNGKITKGDDSDIYSWTSKEDQEFFFDLLSQHTLIVMGRSTYEAAKENIKPDGKKRRIILTTHPEAYVKEEIKGEIEFSDQTPSDLLTMLEKEGVETILLVGGGETNTMFFEAGLVNELFITIEPQLFGNGKPVTSLGNFKTSLDLVESKQLNSKGTLLLHYKISS